MWAYLVVIPAYLVGNLPFAVLVARMAGHDVYAKGSGNPGASNIVRIAGWRWGLLAMVLDILKGFVPTLAVLTFMDRYLSDQQTRVLAYLVAFFCMLGHVVPIGRKGGKGIATGGGAAIALFPPAGIAAILTWAVVMKITKLPVISSLVAAAVLPIWISIDHYYLWECVLVTLLFCFVVLRHIPNIRRFIRREENTVTKHGRDKYRETENS